MHRSERPYNHHVDCPTCDGWGWLGGPGGDYCPDCDGSGRLPRPPVLVTFVLTGMQVPLDYFANTHPKETGK